MGKCRLCGTEARNISSELAVCLGCIRGRPTEALAIAGEAHGRARAAFGLPGRPPAEGLPCNICVIECRIPEGGTGYCGIRTNEGGSLRGVTHEEGRLSWYRDPLPTNCVADWVCPGGTGAGYPEYSHCQVGPERGYRNLAVFFHACTFNCLYCQNWQFRNETLNHNTTPVYRLVADVDERTSCICYFGGDPTPQLPFALRASRLALEEKGDDILRICWETNGSMHKGLLDRMVELSLESGGCIKFDLKAWDENLHVALTGATNSRTLDNFRRAAGQRALRPEPPLVVANTLLVPGYVEEDEIRGISGFIASIDPGIPYSLLAFSPDFYMADMPLTSKAMADRAVRAAQEEGLERVRLGNIHLLT
jgi:pyruvate formate lyase activating enzyme